MAKKTKQAVAAKAIEALDLDKTILVDGQPYNVNAVTADKVVNTLNINSSNSDESGQFDGSAPTTINVMSPSGGAFTGPITVPSHTSEFIDTDVLNFTDTVNVLLANIKNNAVVYNWENNNLDISLTDNAINSISIVSGGESDVDSFHTFNNLRYQQYLEASASGATLEELKDAFYLPVYLYIGTKDNLVYCGIAGTEKANLLNINTASVVAKANTLTTARTITVDLAIEAANGKDFDGGADVTVGVTGKLPIEKVDINESNAEETRDRLGITPANIGAAPTSHNHSASNITGGTLPVARGGTGETDLAKVTVGAATRATQDGNGDTIRTNYYRSASNTTDVNKITISASAPSGGNNGDIWIKY